MKIDLKRTPLYAESWNVAFRKKYNGGIFTDKTTSFKVIKNQFRYWAADPFVFEHNGQIYIFAELYDYILRRGVLGYCRIENGRATKWQPIITEEYHLSYPCIIRRGDKIYIVPESSAGNRLYAYEAVSFPDRWVKVRLFRDNVKLADTTLILNTNLALTHSVEDPTAPKLLLIDLENVHEDRVIDAEALRSRPAGNMFEYNGKKIRPAQLSSDCGDGYGKALIFYECNMDADMNYTEKEIAVIYPQQLKLNRNILLDGMHTYNCCAGYEVIDIKTRRFNILNFVMRIVGKFIGK